MRSPRLRGWPYAQSFRAAPLDVCILGAGATGLVLAEYLTGIGYTVALVEVGSDPVKGAGTSFSDSMTVDSASAHQGIRSGWASGVGGTTQLWGGQLWPWEAREFEERPWLDCPGWPVRYGDLVPYYRRALRTIARAPETHEAIHAAVPARSIGAQYGVRYSSWLGWTERNFARTVAKRLRRRANFAWIEGRGGVHLSPDGNTSFRPYDTEMPVISAKAYVLACGTLGNTRELFAAGSHSPWLGRGFMDHLSTRVASFRIVDHAAFSRAWAPRYKGRVMLTPRMVATDEFLRSNAALNVFGHWEVELSSGSSLAWMRGVLRSLQGRDYSSLNCGFIPRALRTFTPAWAGFRSRLFHRRRYVPGDALIHLRVDVEQPARFTSVLRPSGAHSGPLELNWEIGDAELDTIACFRDALLNDIPFERDGLSLVVCEKSSRITDTYHMMGGTRMGVDPQESVTDAWGRVHGANNLFVVGASNFPTGGVSNPTFTALALALRTGDALIRFLEQQGSDA